MGFSPLTWAVLLLWLTTATASADPKPNTDETTSGDSATRAESESVEESEFHRNHIGLFVGALTPLSRKFETSFALGVGYERRFLKWLGLEAWADFAVGGHERAMIFLAGPIFHPVLGLKIITGVGFELGAEKEHPGARVDYVFAVGAGYDFQAGLVTLTPEFYFDFIGRSTTNIAYGLSAGYSF